MGLFMDGIYFAGKVVLGFFIVIIFLYFVSAVMFVYHLVRFAAGGSRKIVIPVAPPVAPTPPTPPVAPTPPAAAPPPEPPSQTSGFSVNGWR